MFFDGLSITMRHSYSLIVTGAINHDNHYTRDIKHTWQILGTIIEVSVDTES